MYGETQHETPCPNTECPNVITWFTRPPVHCPSCLTDLGLDEHGLPRDRTYDVEEEPTAEGV